MTSARNAAIDAFLKDAGWGDAIRGPLAGDASTRRYERVTGARGIAVLMDAPPNAESAACPPNADEEARTALGYNALARLAGPNQRPFVAIADYLTAHGLSAPRVLAADFEQGLLLLEDLGDAIFNHEIARGLDELPLYEGAIDALLALHEETPPAALPLPGGETFPLLTYDDVAMRAEIALLTEWYLPAAGAANTVAAENELMNIWQGLLAKLPAPDVLVLRDYHADNLLWLPDREGPARVGLLDFQDGLLGHAAYDLVSLLEDARRDVPPALAQAMLDRYIAGRKARGNFDEEAFRFSYALLGLQRNTKILGIFARLWKRDGKPQYPSYIPRLWRYVEGDLAHADFAPFRAWFNTHIPPSWRGDHLQKLAAAEAQS